jgi:hypothetical protein
MQLVRRLQCLLLLCCALFEVPNLQSFGPASLLLWSKRPFPNIVADAAMRACIDAPQY